MPDALEKLTEFADRSFDDNDSNRLVQTHALVVSRHGEVVFEGYGDGFDAASTFLSWSMAKSVASALCGVLVERGDLQLDAPAPVPAWHELAGDPRADITLRQLLQMRSGLEWNEDYVDAGVSDVIEMLFGSGRHDTAGFASAKPLAHAPGSEWVYSSGTTNIICRILGDAIGGGASGFERALLDELLVPAGMSDVSIRFDDAGTWIGSSFLYATARDYVAFGELFRNGGIVDGQGLLSAAWIHASVADQATCADSGQGYGLQWWLARDGHGSFAANGYEGQRLQVVPDLGLTFVRLGKTDAAYSDDLRAFYRAITNCFTT